MLVRQITDDERLAALEISAVAFESPLDRTRPVPQDKNPPHIWASFSDENEMTSTVWVTDFSIRFDGAVCKMGGIGGVASLPQHRRSGGIRTCFEALLPQLYRDGYVFSYLYPFSTTYYRKFGYECCVQRYQAAANLPLLAPPAVGGTLRMATPADPLYSDVRALDAHWEARYNMAVQHEQADYDWLLQCDPAAKQEFTYVWYDAHHAPKSYATFALKLEADGRNLVCSRFRFSGSEGYYGLMTLFSRLAADHQSVKFRIPTEPALQYLMPEWSLGAARWTLEAAGMVRVINAAAALRLARYRGSGMVTLRLHDAQIAENNATFCVRFQDGHALSVERTDVQPDAELEISTFSALLAGVCSFEAARESFPGLNVFGNADALAQVFYQKPLFIEDYF